MAKKHTRRHLLTTGTAAGLAAMGAAASAAASAVEKPAAPGNAAPAGKGQGAPQAPSAANLQFVGYCGIYCGLCDRRTRVPEHAAALKQAMEKAECDASEKFWDFLKELAEPPADKCCRTGKCGAGFCAIRKCIKAKGLVVCPECAEYPCKRVRLFGESEPLLLADGQRIRAKGLDSWVKEQEQRRADCFCYAQIRCYPYHFPDT